MCALDDDLEVVVVDALAAFGWLLRSVLLDGYRLQLRHAPWLFSGFFSAFRRSRTLRAVGRRGLTLFGGRGLGRALDALAPDIVVSTYPAATSVLGALRLRGRFRVPTCATITDLAGAAFWSHPGIDLHLVMHADVVSDVEGEAGAGSARVVQPLVSKRFNERPNRLTARAELELPPNESIVVVSGGGWGVGDLVGAIETARTLPSTHVICLAGRSDATLRHLEALFANDPLVRVLPFTSQMPELFAAADAIVHATGGVTLLEALVCGCPVIAFGAPPGHAPALAEAAANLGLATYARTREELHAALANPRRAVVNVEEHTPAAAAAVLAASLRLLTPKRRTHVAPALAAASLLLSAFVMGSSEAAFAVVDGPLGLKPSSAIETTTPRVGLVLSASRQDVPALTRLIAARGATASFVFRRPPSRHIVTLLSRNGDAVIAELPAAGIDDWLGTLDQLRDAKSNVASDWGLFALAPPTGASAGQYVLAREAGTILLADTHLYRIGPAWSLRLTRGRVVVTAANTSAPSEAKLNRMLALIRERGLRPSALPALVPSH